VQNLLCVPQGVDLSFVSGAASLGEYRLKPGQNSGVFPADAGDQGGQKFLVGLNSAFEVGGFAGVHLHLQGGLA
jgi:hypothetical protein